MNRLIAISIAAALAAVPAAASLPTGAKAPMFSTQAAKAGKAFGFNLRSALAKGPVVLYLFWNGLSVKALVMLAWGVGVVSTVDQVLRPWLIGRDVPIPILFLVFSVLGGLVLYGPIGLFAGPVLVSLFMTALQIYREEYHAVDVPPARPAAPVPPMAS